MKKKFQSRWVLLILAVAVALSASLIGFVSAKYATQINYEGKITFSASLAEDVRLLEHKAVRQPDGSYQLTSDTTDGNSYILLPGVDIPKDPYIEIEKKTVIPAFLYVEVVENGDVSISGKTITYSLNEKWMKLDGVTGKNGGTVYVYCGGTPNPLAITAANTSAETWTVDILEPLVDGKPETVQVSQSLVSGNSGGDDILKFYASLGEVSGNTQGSDDAKTVYNNL